MNASDETAITEVTIQPDGRIYVFGASVEVLSILRDLCPHDPQLLERLSRSVFAPNACGGSSDQKPSLNF